MTLRTHIAKAEIQSQWNSGRETVRPSTRHSKSHLAMFTTTTIIQDNPMELMNTKSLKDSELGPGRVSEDQKARVSLQVE